MATQKFFLLLFGYTAYALISPWFALILFVYTGIVGSVSFLLHRLSEGALRATLSALGIGSGLALLAYFKYFNFFGRQIEGFVQLLGLQWALPVIDVLMPLGISFYVFQAISYLVEVQKSAIVPAGPVNLGLYLCFLPTLLAGPICRPHQLLAQISSGESRIISDPNRVILLICSFVIKKVWLASWLAESIVDPVFAEPSFFNGAELAMAAVAYAFQIYFDFSGYTDLAVVIALLLGYDLPPNFNFPYLASSLSEFWGRWHITLSLWIRDFIYIPIGGSRHGTWRMLVSLMTAMTLSGLWHGASVKYVIWGALHGSALSLEKLVAKYANIRLGWFFTFFVVCIGWIFFRSSTLELAVSFLKSCADWTLPLNPDLPHLSFLLLIAVSFVVWRNAEKILRACQAFLAGLPFVFRPLVAALVITAALSVSPDGMPAFIYAQF